MADEEVAPHAHVYNWEQDGRDSVHKCSCGNEQARLKNAYPTED